MILIVNLNLAIDEIVCVEGLKPGHVHRTGKALRQAGGKGVNISRVLKAFDEPALLTGFLGGRAGEFIKNELEREGLQSTSTRIEGESRTCIILDDQLTLSQTVINEAGPLILETEWREFTKDYERLLSSAELVIITGSLPANLKPDAYAQLIEMARACGKRALLDTALEPLRAALKARPFFLKINQREAAELLESSVHDVGSMREAARRLKAEGAENVMITMGEAGALLNFAEAEYYIKPPRIEARNSVGSGDALMAGLAYALRRGLNVEEAARFSVAAGAVNALYGFGRITLEEVLGLKQAVEISSAAG